MTERGQNGEEIDRMNDLRSAISGVATENLSRRNWTTPIDYFSWGRDGRHRVDDTESLPDAPREEAKPSLKRRVRLFLKAMRQRDHVDEILQRFGDDYERFEETYQLISDQPSRRLFAELILMKIISEQNARLSSFTAEFVDSYEAASAQILASDETLPVYTWVLRKIALSAPNVSFFTVPTILNLHLTNRLYRYQRAAVTIEVGAGDVVLDAGVGWGDTCIYLAARANEGSGGHVYAFDILEEGLAALARQTDINPHLRNITPVLIGVSDSDGASVWIDNPGPGAHITDTNTGRQIETITIDTFCAEQALKKVDFIKMDIEGGEVPALSGGAATILSHKPKLAISAYHKWDDLLVIPKLIHSIRDDYSYYLDCTTGFGGEAVLYCC